MSHSKLDLHDYSKAMREGNHTYTEAYQQYAAKYLSE